jgi:uncharacterized protein YndB with AHSA1/START domain
VGRSEHAVEIEASAARIFPYLVEHEQRLRWMGALAESEPLTDGPPEIGTRFRDVFETHGRRIELEAEVAGYEPGRRLQVRLSTRGFEATSTQELEETDGRTRLTSVLETQARSLAARLAAGVVDRGAHAQLESDLARLKALVEAEAASGEA